LAVRVKDGVSQDKIITNTVTADSDETDPTSKSTDEADVSTGDSPSPVQGFSILPEIIRDTGGSYDIQAAAILPEGFGKDDVGDELPILYLTDPYSNKVKVSAHSQVVYGTETRAKVIALFDKDALMAAMSEAALSDSQITGHGEVTLMVVGQLAKGGAWYGQDTVRISGYVGR
jgi:hypothetical protein